MAHRLAVAAVIAHDGGFDDAGTRFLCAGRHVECPVTWMPEEGRGFEGSQIRGLRTVHTGNRLPDELPQFLFGHSCTSTASTIPTMAASTGAPLRPSASPAARPSMTTSTFSCTPAPTESTASSAVPRGASSSPIGCTSSSLAPPNLACFCVATTVPTTRASCMGACAGPVLSDRPWARPKGRALRYVYLIDDAHDAGVSGHFGRIEGKRRFLAAHEEHRLADAGADRIHRDERSARR